MTIPLSMVRALVICALAAGDVHAAEAPWIPETVRLSARAGYSDEVRRTLPCPNGLFSANLTLRNPRLEQPWVPGAVILFQSATEFGRFGMQTSSLSGPLRPAHQWGPMGVPANRKRYWGSKTFKFGQTVKLEVSWVDSRRISARIDGEALPLLNLRDPIKDIMLVAVGSDVVFQRNELQCSLIS